MDVLETCCWFLEAVELPVAADLAVLLKLLFHFVCDTVLVIAVDLQTDGVPTLTPSRATVTARPSEGPTMEAIMTKDHRG